MAMCDMISEQLDIVTRYLDSNNDSLKCDTNNNRNTSLTVSERKQQKSNTSGVKLKPLTGHTSCGNQRKNINETVEKSQTSRQMKGRANLSPVPHAKHATMNLKPLPEKRKSLPPSCTGAKSKCELDNDFTKVSKVSSKVRGTGTDVNANKLTSVEVDEERKYKYETAMTVNITVEGREGTVPNTKERNEKIEVHACSNLSVQENKMVTSATFSTAPTTSVGEAREIKSVKHRQIKKLQEKSQSSDRLFRRKVKEENDQSCSKVKIEGKCHQIIEARRTSHHYSWTIPDPGSQKLNWHKPPLTVLVVKKIYDETVLRPFKELITWLIEVRKMIVYVENSVLKDANLAGDTSFQKHRKNLQTFRDAKDDLTDKIDFIICLGGDGTLLHASSLFQQSCPPVMAFHQGSLGFLTPFSFDNFQTQVKEVLEGNASLLLRYRLKCVICRANDETNNVKSIKHIDRMSPCGKSQILVLNEVVVDRGSSSFICNIDVYVEGRHVTSVQGDGLIISTPTGSTAYAVAAGASMIHPNVPAIMITPICPHSLSFRPIVVPAGVELKIMLSPEARNSAMVSFDGRNRQEIHHGDSVRITTAQFPLPAVCAKDQIDDWFDRLGECLHWNVRKSQKSLSLSSTTSEASVTSSNSNHSNSDQGNSDTNSVEREVETLSI